VADVYSTACTMPRPSSSSALSIKARSAVTVMPSGSMTNAILAALFHVKHKARRTGRGNDEIVQLDERGLADAIERNADADVVRQAHFHVSSA